MAAMNSLTSIIIEEFLELCRLEICIHSLRTSLKQEIMFKCGAVDRACKTLPQSTAGKDLFKKRPISGISGVGPALAPSVFQDQNHTLRVAPLAHRYIETQPRASAAHMLAARFMYLN